MLLLNAIPDPHDDQDALGYDAPATPDLLSASQLAAERGELEGVRDFSDEEVEEFLEEDQLDEDLTRQIDRFMTLRRAKKERSTP